MIRKVLIFFLPISILFAIAMVVIASYSGRQAPNTATLSPLLIAALVSLTLLLLTLSTWLAARSILKPFDQLAETLRLFLEGNWEQRAAGETLRASRQLGLLFNQMADQLAEMQRNLVLRKEDNGASARMALVKLGEIIASGQDLEAMLSQALEVIVDRFECDYGALYLVEKISSPGNQLATRQHTYGDQDFLVERLPGRIQAQMIRVESLEAKDWPMAQAITSGHARVGSIQFERGSAVNKVFEAAIPIMTSNQVVAAFDLYATGRRAESRLGPFSTRTLSELEAFANLIAAALDKPSTDSPHSRTPTDKVPQTDPHTLDMLYRAGRQLLHARTRSEALAIAASSLEQSPYAAAILLADGEKLTLADPTGQDPLKIAGAPDKKTALPANQIAQFFASLPATNGPFLIVNGLENRYLPQGLLDVCRAMGFNSAAFIPAPRGFGLAAILVLGWKPSASHTNGFTHPSTLSLELGPYKYLIEQLASNLERLQMADGTSQQEAELETLWNISQAIAVETDLDALYHTIHQQVVRYLGEVSSFAIALYDSSQDRIEIPYLFEEGKSMHVPPFPLGEGLTSIVIHTGKPLMIVEEAEQQAEALGAKLIGEPAKSWLGVPLLYRGEAIGVMVAQDIHHEHRFNLDDQRLFSALASQVAVMVRNAMLYQTSQKYARHERLVNQISDRIRQAADINHILKTTAEELGTALNLHSAQIEIQVEPTKTSQVRAAPAQGNGSAADPAYDEESAT